MEASRRDHNPATMAHIPAVMLINRAAIPIRSLPAGKLRNRIQLSRTVFSQRFYCILCYS